MPYQDPQPAQRQQPASGVVAAPVVAEVDPVMVLEVGLDGVRVVAEEPSQPSDSPTESRPIDSA